MGLWDFVKNAGKAIGIGDAKAEDAPADAKPGADAAPSPEALKKEIEDLGLKTENLDIKVDGDTVKVTGKALSQEDKEKVIIAVGNVAGVAKVDEELEVARARGAAGVPHGRKGRQPLEDLREDPWQRCALQGNLRGQQADVDGSGQDLSWASAANPGEVENPGVARPRPSRYRREGAPGKRRRREDAWRGSRRLRTSRPSSARCPGATGWRHGRSTSS